MAIQLTTLGQYAIDYYEEAEGWRERWTQDGVELVRCLRVAWADRREFVLDMLGHNTFFEGGGSIVRALPEAHPYQDNLYAQSCDLKRIVGVPCQDDEGRHTVEEREVDGSLEDPEDGQGTGWVVYDVTYKRLDYDVKADADVTTEVDRFVTKDFKFTVESLTIPGQSLAWGVIGDVGEPPGTAIPSGSFALVTIPQPTGRLYPMCAITYTWRQVPQLMLQKLLAAQGKINSAAFDVNSFSGGFPAETLLLKQIEATRVQHPAAVVYWEIVFSFLSRRTGWRKLMNRDGDFYKVVPEVAGKPGLYETVDFATLFTLTP